VGAVELTLPTLISPALREYTAGYLVENSDAACLYKWTFQVSPYLSIEDCWAWVHTRRMRNLMTVTVGSALLSNILDEFQCRVTWAHEMLHGWSERIASGYYEALDEHVSATVMSAAMTGAVQWEELMADELSYKIAHNMTPWAPPKSIPEVADAIKQTKIRKLQGLDGVPPDLCVAPSERCPRNWKRLKVRGLSEW